MEDKRVSVFITTGTEATLMRYENGDVTKTKYNNPREIQRALDALKEELENWGEA